MTYLDDARATGASDSVIAGLDLLVDDGMPADKAARMLVAVERQGKDAEAFARHLLTLRRAARP